MPATDFHQGAHCNILTELSDIEFIAEDWRSLQSSRGQTPFTGFDLIHHWWRTAGMADRTLSPHVVTGWRDGDLVAVLPLVVARVAGARVLMGAGGHPDRFCDVLCDDRHAADMAWEAVRRSDTYDFAVLRGVHTDGFSFYNLYPFATRRDVLREYFVQIRGGRGRGECERDVPGMGRVTLEVHHGFGVSPGMIRSIRDARRRWAWANGKRNVRDGKADLLDVAGEEGSLVVTTMRCGDALAGFQASLLYERVLYEEMAAHDPKWAGFPARAIIETTIRWATDHGVSALNLARAGRRGRLVEPRYANNIVETQEFSFHRSGLGRIAEEAYFAGRSLGRRLGFRRETPRVST